MGTSLLRRASAAPSRSLRIPRGTRVAPPSLSRIISINNNMTMAHHHPQHHHPPHQSADARRCFSTGVGGGGGFSFAGPRRLDDLIKKERLQGKSGTEIADIWYTYHEEKVRSYLQMVSRR